MGRLAEKHSEQELQIAIIANLKRFLLELGRDFAFVGEQYVLQAARGRDAPPVTLPNWKAGIAGLLHVRAGSRPELPICALERELLILRSSFRFR